MRYLRVLEFMKVESGMVVARDTGKIGEGDAVSEMPDEESWRWPAQQHKCTQCYPHVHLRMVRMVDFMLYVFYNN